MGNVQINAPVKKLELEAVVTRANGDKENLGMIAHWEKKESFFKKIVRRMK